MDADGDGAISEAELDAALALLLPQVEPVSRRLLLDDETMMLRAGFLKSGVSDHNRLIERHESNYGAYWVSYDFKRVGGGALQDLRKEGKTMTAKKMNIEGFCDSIYADLLDMKFKVGEFDN